MSPVPFTLCVGSQALSLICYSNRLQDLLMPDQSCTEDISAQGEQISAQGCARRTCVCVGQCGLLMADSMGVESGMG